MLIVVLRIVALLRAIFMGHFEATDTDFPADPVQGVLNTFQTAHMIHQEMAFKVSDFFQLDGRPLSRLMILPSLAKPGIKIQIMEVSCGTPAELFKQARFCFNMGITISRNHSRPGVADKGKFEASVEFSLAQNVLDLNRRQVLRPARLGITNLIKPILFFDRLRQPFP